MEQTSRIVTVDIHGQRYPIRSSLDAAYVAELAAYVDEKMRLALQECPAGDTLKVAVLAALNIADEYFRAGDEVEDRQAGFAHRAAELERMLDMALASGRNGSPRADRRPRRATPRSATTRHDTDLCRPRHRGAVQWHPGVRVPCFACDGSEARLSQCSNPSESRRCAVCMPLREEA